MQKFHFRCAVKEAARRACLFCTSSPADGIKETPKYYSAPRCIKNLRVEIASEAYTYSQSAAAKAASTHVGAQVWQIDVCEAQPTAAAGAHRALFCMNKSVKRHLYLRSRLLAP